MCSPDSNFASHENKSWELFLHSLVAALVLNRNREASRNVLKAVQEATGRFDLRLALAALIAIIITAAASGERIIFRKEPEVGINFKLD